MSKLVDGKIALVTGAASGIGRSTAELFAREGAKVVCSDINVAGGQETVSTITDAGGDAVFIRCDVSDEADVKALIAATVAHYGRLDCAFNNAGSPGPTGKLFVEYDVDAFDRTIAINLRSVWLCMRYQIVQMLEQGGGSIVNTASTGGLGGYPTLSAYTGAKHGVVGLTRTAALEYAAQRIRINAICPGPTLTAMADDVIGDKPGDMEAAMAVVTATVPMGRIADPSEQAEAAVWLSSDRASFITGVPLPVAGGIGCHG